MKENWNFDDYLQYFVLYITQNLVQLSMDKVLNATYSSAIMMFCLNQGNYWS